MRGRHEASAGGEEDGNAQGEEQQRSPSRKHPGFLGVNNTIPALGTEEGVLAPHVREDTHVCSLSQGPVLTRRRGIFPRLEEEEEGDGISGSLPAPPATGTTPHTSTSRRLHGWVNTRSVIPSTPQQQREGRNRCENHTKTPPRGPRALSTSRILHPLPPPSQELSTRRCPKSWKNTLKGGPPKPLGSTRAHWGAELHPSRAKPHRRGITISRSWPSFALPTAAA